MSQLEDVEVSSDSFSRRLLHRAVFVLGPSSSGKTTLCDALAEHLNIRSPQYIKEVARNVMKTHGFTRDDTDTYEMQHAIMLAQLAAEEEAAKALVDGGHNSVAILSDRSAVDPIVYATTSTVPGASDHRQRLLSDPRLQRMLPAYRTSLFVVLEPVQEWVFDDGVRSLEDPWAYNLALFATLRELDIPHMVINEEMRDIGERVNLVMRNLYQPRSV